jgi:alpha-galactosidase/6-phospho-beta-glucosidase family protein
MKVKLAYIGGGSLFVPSIINGIAEVMRREGARFEVQLSLFDIQRDKAERMEAYCDIVQKHCKVPLHAYVAGERVEALDGADLVLVSAWLGTEHQRLERLRERLGFQLPLEGPGVAGWAVACTPWCLGVAAEMKRRCPEALFATLMNPTDVLAGVVGEVGGVQAVGLCVEVDGLVGALAYYLRVPFDAIEMTYGGVNHDGWVLTLQVGGRDGYELLRAEWDRIKSDPEFHPGSHGIRPILDLTGHLRSSAYHNWPYGVEAGPRREELWHRWRGKRARYQAALERALQTKTPIADPAAIHPERSLLNYPFTGVTVGRLVQSIAVHTRNVIPLQIVNRGAIDNFPEDVIVEVPTEVQGRNLQGKMVGALPEWLGGYTRLLAIQRRLMVKYLQDRRLPTLKQALATFPMFGTVQQLNQYAEVLHREYGDDVVQ